MTLSAPLLQLRGTAAVLERQRCLKRCRHLLDAWCGQRLETLERCIALLLEQETTEAPAPLNLNMETRIDALFADLNRDALRFQELYYNERKHIGHLDRQRCPGLAETLAAAPAAA